MSAPTKRLDVRVSRSIVASPKWRVDRAGDGCECIVWRGTRDEKGYGRVWLGGPAGRGGNYAKAHRVAWVAAHGADVPGGLVIDHLCRNRACVNPYHLEPVTWGENTRRGEASAWRRAKTHCPRNHPYAGDNLVLTSDGRRRCRICVNASCRASKARRRAASNTDHHAGRRFTDKEA